MPVGAKYKVYIIDEVHMMTTGAFNALLKTIEEPPAHVVFILATTEPNKVIPTIISRCQRFDFNKVSQKDIERRLSIVCNEEKIEIEPSAISLIAQLADGGMRDSLSILDQCVAYCSSNISADNVREIYGVLTTEDLGILFEYLYENEVDKLIQKIQDCSDSGMDLKRLTSDLISLLKESIILDYSRDSRLVKEEHKQIIEKYLLRSPSLFRFNVLNELMDVYNKYNYASNVLDYLETALLKSISNSYETNNKQLKSITDWGHHRIRRDASSASSWHLCTCPSVSSRPPIPERAWPWRHRRSRRRCLPLCGARSCRAGSCRRPSHRHG